LARRRLLVPGEIAQPWSPIMAQRNLLAVFLAACAVTVCAVRDGAAAGDAAAGRRKALMCQTGHGLDGRAKIPEAPNLAGQSAVYLGKALKDYRSGARKNDMMSIVAPALKDEDIDDLAAYYSSIEVTVAPPPK